MNQVTEKWEKVYEIHFNQGKHADDHVHDEHIVDFEIIHSSITDNGNGFQIKLALYTSFNQYLVYETHTSMLAGLKSLTSTKLLFHAYTTDNLIQLLGSVHFESEWSSSMSTKNKSFPVGKNKTVLALMTEVDPNRQR